MEKIDQAARKSRRAETAAAEAFAELRAATIETVNEHGMTESEAARRAGVDRMTVRKWLGKGKRS